jgi:hypothetical protein
MKSPQNAKIILNSSAWHLEIQPMPNKTDKDKKVWSHNIQSLLTAKNESILKFQFGTFTFNLYVNRRM